MDKLEKVTYAGCAVIIVLSMALVAALMVLLFKVIVGLI